jgi:hypothetical protein
MWIIISTKTKAKYLEHIYSRANCFLIISTKILFEQDWFTRWKIGLFPFRDYAGSRDGTSLIQQLAFHLFQLKRESFCRDSCHAIDKQASRNIF